LQTWWKSAKFTISILDVSQLLIWLAHHIIPFYNISNYLLAAVDGGSIKQFGSGILQRVLFKQIKSAEEYRALFVFNTLCVLFDVFFVSFWDRCYCFIFKTLNCSFSFWVVFCSFGWLCHGAQQLFWDCVSFYLLLSGQNAFLYCTYAQYVPLNIVLFDYLVFLRQKKNTKNTKTHTHHTLNIG